MGSQFKGATGAAVSSSVRNPLLHCYNNKIFLVSCYQTLPDLLSLLTAYNHVVGVIGHR